mmetsp:Transcript_25498/g.51017  ORF Transcript_25498/g.51017 Transcript_25498/m.51017 type:complete len:298 (-) Transcript_25498:71-964(-)
MACHTAAVTIKGPLLSRFSAVTLLPGLANGTGLFWRLGRSGQLAHLPPVVITMRFLGQWLALPEHVQRRGGEGGGILAWNTVRERLIHVLFRRKLELRLKIAVLHLLYCFKAPSEFLGSVCSISDKILCSSPVQLFGVQISSVLNQKLDTFCLALKSCIVHCLGPRVEGASVHVSAVSYQFSCAVCVAATHCFHERGVPVLVLFVDIGVVFQENHQTFQISTPGHQHQRSFIHFVVQVAKVLVCAVLQHHPHSLSIPQCNSSLKRNTVPVVLDIDLVFCTYPKRLQLLCQRLQRLQM